MGGSNPIPRSSSSNHARWIPRLGRLLVWSSSPSAEITTILTVPNSNIPPFPKLPATGDRSNPIPCSSSTIHALWIPRLGRLLVRSSSPSTEITLIFAVPNSNIPPFPKLPAAGDWVSSHVAPFYRAANISLVAGGMGKLRCQRSTQT